MEKMICPECAAGEMERFWRVRFVKRGYGTCKVCKYTCSVDFVSGFWAGVRSTIGKSKSDGQVMACPLCKGSGQMPKPDTKGDLAIIEEG